MAGRLGSRCQGSMWSQHRRFLHPMVRLQACSCAVECFSAGMTSHCPPLMSGMLVEGDVAVTSDSVERD